MSSRVLLTLSILILAFSTLSFKWPLESGRLTSTFGESRGDHFHDGVDLVCPDDKVYSVTDGQVMYYWDRSIFPLDNDPGGGNLVILQHADDVYSIYMHLLEGSIMPFAEAGKQLAAVGNSGHSYAKHLHISLLKKTLRQSINPLSVFPEYNDAVAPTIDAMYLKIGEKYIQVRDNASIRLTRHYPILVDIKDTVTGAEKLGIYSLAALFNGKQVLDIKFDTIGFSEQGLLVDEKLFPAVMDVKGYYIIDGLKHKQGDNILEITARDYRGNIGVKTFRYSADLDMEQTL